MTLLVEDYDSAIAFFTEILGFELCEDTEAFSEDGQPKRWVVVRPPRAETGLLLARAAGRHQRAHIGDQAAGRVGFFLQVGDVDAMVTHLRANGVHIAREPRDESYGRVAVFCDIAGNHWDLLGPE